MGVYGPGCRVLLGTSTERSSPSSRLGTAFVWYLAVLITLIAFAFLVKSACLEGDTATMSLYYELIPNSFAQ